MSLVTANRLSGQVRNRSAITWAIANAPSQHPDPSLVNHGLSHGWQGIETLEGDRPQQTVPHKFYLQLNDILWDGRNDHHRVGLLNHLGGWAWAS